MSFSERLKSRRIEQRYSLDEISKLVGVKGNTVWRWENDRAKPDTETVIKIAQALNTSAAYLLGETDNPTATGQMFDIMAVTPQETNEDTDIKEHITAGRRNGMYIIKDGAREFCMPDNPTGQEIFLKLACSMFNGAKLSEALALNNANLNINNGTNSSYHDSIVHNGTSTITQVGMSE